VKNIFINLNFKASPERNAITLVYSGFLMRAFPLNLLPQCGRVAPHNTHIEEFIQDTKSIRLKAEKYISKILLVMKVNCWPLEKLPIVALENRCSQVFILS
jgi:hypothetical protein